MTKKGGGKAEAYDLALPKGHYYDEQMEVRKAGLLIEVDGAVVEVDAREEHLLALIDQAIAIAGSKRMRMVRYLLDMVRIELVSVLAKDAPSKRAC